VCAPVSAVLGAGLLAAGCGRLYFKINASFLKYGRQPASACALMCGKYIRAPAAIRQFASATNLTTHDKQILGKIPVDKTESFVPGTFDGRPVLVGHGGGVTLDVAAGRIPYPIAVRQPCGPTSYGGSTVFSEWDAVPKPLAPSASEIINPGQLGQPVDDL
jgi:hypothetical protein